MSGEAALLPIPRGRRLPLPRLGFGRFVGPILVLACGVLIVYPVIFLILESLNAGDPETFPPVQWGLTNYREAIADIHILANTAEVAVISTVLAIIAGFLLAWILTRTTIPGRRMLERMMELPYYMTPLVGALAWGILAGPKAGLINQVMQRLVGRNDIFNVYSPLGIGWVMALFEGTVAFVMIAAAMKSMDPSLEESSRVLGGGKARTALRITLPLMAPAVLGAGVFVFSEMLGAFAAAFVLGIPARFYVVTTAIWEATLSFPPDYGRAAALGLSLFGVMLITLTISKLIIRGGSYATISGKAFRPRPVDVGWLRWLMLAICWSYVGVGVILPLAALLLTSFQKFATAFLSESIFTTANYRNALAMGTLGSAFTNSLMLGFIVATVGALVIGILVWVIYRSRMPGRGPAEYLLMLPQAVPRLVFGLGLLWAWINIPIPLYGTLWLMGIAYFTVFIPLGLRTIAGVVLQIDPTLDECARVCGASWGQRMRTVNLPLLRPGLAAAWLLIFIASVRELGVSIFLMGPHSKVIAPAITNAWLSSSSELSAAMALLQTGTVFIAVIVLFRATRGLAGQTA